MITSQLIRIVVAMVLAAFGLSHAAKASDYYDGNVYVTSAAQAPNGGFWIQVNDTVNGGRTVVSGGAPVFESVNAPGTLVAIPGKNGYWVITKRGDIHARGEAPLLCEGHLSKCSNFPSNPGANSYVTHAAATPDGGGFWALGDHGQVWTAGTAMPFGDYRNDTTSVGTAITPTPSGKGYYILMSDGGVHARGDAEFFGSTGGHFHREYNGLVLSRTAVGAVNGYWMLEQDGSVHAYGDAATLGPAGGGSSRITSLFPVDGGIRYGSVTYDGKIGLSNSYRRGPVSTSEYDLSPVWTLNGGVDKPGTELHAATLGSSRVESWVFWPIRWNGTYVNQVRNERNGMCLEVRSDVLVLAACQQDLLKMKPQAFWIVDGANGTFWVVWAPHPQYYLVKEEGSRLRLLTAGNGEWRTLDVTTVTSEATGAQWHTWNAVGNQTSTSVPGPETPRQNWVVAATAPVPGSTVRFISMETGYCGEFKWLDGAHHLFQSVCQPAVQPQTFRLMEDGPKAYRINIAFSDSVGAAPAWNHGVMFSAASVRWNMDLSKLP
ncbi:hypothetical protein [uncultured Paludibaculum sp.]|uniref:hypothetical protein n=1 Tax=uncultured Paludibaculum sp. TaxID=1765020 RepID=UPI002AAAEDAE|nr:hypothetical protein [uncultured Paludibaculum sp.]